jgi:hypothetical protein
MPIAFKKEKICVEDIVLSMDTEIEQSRGILTPFNAAYLHYSDTQSVTVALDDRYTKSEADGRYAYKSGSDTQTFNVAMAVNGSEAVNLTQMTTELDDLDTRKVEQGTVLRTDIDNGTYNPQYPSSPATKQYVDAQIEDKFLGAVTGKFIAKNIDGSGNDVIIQVTNGVITQIG